MHELIFQSRNESLKGMSDLFTLNNPCFSGSGFVIVHFSDLVDLNSPPVPRNFLFGHFDSCICYSMAYLLVTCNLSSVR